MVLSLLFVVVVVAGAAGVGLCFGRDLLVDCFVGGVHAVAIIVAGGDAVAVVVVEVRVILLLLLLLLMIFSLFQLLLLLVMV